MTIGSEPLDGDSVMELSTGTVLWLIIIPGSDVLTAVVIEETVELKVVEIEDNTEVDGVEGVDDDDDESPVG